MTGVRWALVRALSNRLAADERDAVLGDILELQTPAGRALRDVAGLVVRRQTEGLVRWRAALTLGAVVVPLAVLIGLVSRFYAEGSAISAFVYIDNWSSAVLDSPGGRQDLAHVVLTQIVGFVTLCVWSWLMGFMIASLSRATALASGCAFGLVLLAEFLAVPQYHHPGNAAAFESMVYRVVLPLTMRACFVLGPAIWGMRDGARRATLDTPATLALALVATVLTTMASRRIGFAARGGWWPLLSVWKVAVQGAVWLPLAYLVGTAVWHRRAGSLVRDS